MKKQNDAFDEKEEKMKKEIEKKGRENAELMGKIQEYESKVGVMHGDLKVAAEGAEKTRLENEALLNVEKDKYVQSKDADRDLRTKEHTRVQDKLQNAIDDLRRENDLLREAEHEWKIR